MPETPTTFYHSKRNGPTDYPVYNHKNELFCVCPTEDLACLVINAMKDFNKPEPELARDVKPSTLKDLDTGEPVLFIRASDFEAMRREIKAGKWALDACQKSEIELLKRAEIHRAQLTERAAIIKDLEAQARVMMVQIEEDKMAISALREDAAKDAQELRSRRSRQEPTATERQRNADDMGWPPRSPAFVPPPPTGNADADRPDFPLEMTNEPVLRNTPVMQKTGELRNVYGAVIATYLPDKEVWKCRNGHHWPTPEAAAACDIGDCDTPF